MRYIVEVSNEKVAEYKTLEQANKFINTMNNINKQYNHPQVKYTILVL